MSNFHYFLEVNVGLKLNVESINKLIRDNSEQYTPYCICIINYCE